MLFFFVIPLFCHFFPFKGRVICGSLRGGIVAVVIWTARGTAGKAGFGIDLAETLAPLKTIAPSSSVLAASTVCFFEV